MLHKTRGLIFHTTDFGETSLVAKIYTEVFGIQSYLINSVRKKNARIHSNIFQPLTPVDLVVYHKERPGLQRISDIRPNPPLASIPFDVSKSSIVFFLDEILYKSIREEEANPQLFEFIRKAVLDLDEASVAGNDFHIIFLIQLSRYLGFGPTNNFSETKNIFNLKEGNFQETFPDHPNFIPLSLGREFSRLIDADLNFSSALNTAERRLLINYVIEFFNLHIDSLGIIKSHKVLEEVWDQD